MKLLIQRVQKCRVTVEKAPVGEIGIGALVFLGIHKEDGADQIPPLVKKLVHLRFFSDEAGKTNLSLADIQGELLIVSQFTLYADCKSGRRPSFTEAASGPLAQQLYDQFVLEARNTGLRIETGVFGANMQVEIHNDGPFTLILEDR